MAKIEQGAARYGAQRGVFERNRKIIMASEDVCGICGRWVDKHIPSPDPMSATVDHIIPLEKGGSNELDNLQLAHRCCNRAKGSKIPGDVRTEASQINGLVSNRNLPLHIDWLNQKTSNKRPPK